MWQQVAGDVRAELLGPEAKVSTHKPSPLSEGPGRHVICVYTKSLEDKNDILRVAQRLVTTAELKMMRISYKSDAQTLAGEYSWNAAGGVALYTLGPPYQELGLPPSPRTREGGSGDEDSAPDGFCGGCRRPVRATRQKCTSCGWVFSSDALACLARADLPLRQRQAIELGAGGVAQTPRREREGADVHALRVHETMRRLAAASTRWDGNDRARRSWEANRGAHEDLWSDARCAPPRALEKLVELSVDVATERRSEVVMELQPLEQWRCDGCGDLIEKPADGAVVYRYAQLPPETRHVDFRITHNGNVRNGECQVSSSGATPLGDKLLDDLVGSRAILSMLGVQSADPTWAETLRRLAVPYYEEARRYFDDARADGREVIEDKLDERKLVAIIERFGK